MAELNTDEKIVIACGAMIGGLIIIALIAIVVRTCYSKKKQGSKSQADDDDDEFYNLGYMPGGEPMQYLPPYAGGPRPALPYPQWGDDSRQGPYMLPMPQSYGYSSNYLEYHEDPAIPNGADDRRREMHSVEKIHGPNSGSNARKGSRK